MLYGSTAAYYVEFPAAEVLGPDSTEDDIQGLIDRHKLIFIKPLFRGGVGKKGKSGLIGKATDLKTALKEKERLNFVEHRHGNANLSDAQLLPSVHRWNVMSEQRKSAEGSIVCGVIED